MGHNVSQRKRRELVMASPVADFDTFEFDVTCSVCRRETTFLVSDLVPRFGTRTMGEVTAKLCCRLPGCGGKPSLLTLRRGGFPIPIVGPGVLRLISRFGAPQ